jgi:hypothetical protein
MYTLLAISMDGRRYISDMDSVSGMHKHILGMVLGE